VRRRSGLAGYFLGEVVVQRDDLAVIELRTMKPSRSVIWSMRAAMSSADGVLS